jgi:[ribosomal protein S5]-alanine N-acetyltransferase
MLREGRVILTAIDPSNAEIVRGWVSDPSVNEWMVSGHLPITPAAELAWYEHAEAQANAGAAYQFEIHAADDSRLLGMCGVIEIDRIDRHGELGILIGDTAEHGKGFGRDALCGLLRFAFETLGLNTVRIRAIQGNERALGLYRSLGFSDVGTWRQGRYVRGRFHDVVLLDFTRVDFDAQGSS